MSLFMAFSLNLLVSFSSLAQHKGQEANYLLIRLYTLCLRITSSCQVLPWLIKVIVISKVSSSFNSLTGSLQIIKVMLELN